MAFCNSCGATLDTGAKFCNKCGTTQPGAAAASVTPVLTPASPQKSSSALKIILIVVAAIIVLGILGIGAVSFIGYRIAKRSRIHNENGNVRVETPFGTMDTSTDPDEAARNLGIDLYPGAEVVKGTTSNMTMGAMHTATADFETGDPVSAVSEFYKSRLPNANVVSTSGDRYAIISTDKKNMLTINIEPKDGKTRIHIARVSGKMMNGGDSDN
ncbi:MAG: zinc ribbon domain-containing protein [Acidobacteriia bacterium]|nr:zinc ribbon domain-containing protein [Terriglobia bacterium]